MTTPADPGAIDLDEIKDYLVANENAMNIQRERAKAAEARVVELEEAVSVLRSYYATKFGQHAMVKQVGIFLAKLDTLKA